VSVRPVLSLGEQSSRSERPEQASQSKMLLTTDRLILRGFVARDWEAVLAYQQHPQKSLRRCAFALNYPFLSGES
jgi:hypothetical protein